MNRSLLCVLLTAAGLLTACDKPTARVDADGKPVCPACVTDTGSGTPEATQKAPAMDTKPTPPPPLTHEQAAKMTEADWKARLSPEQYRVLRQKGTERAFTGKYFDTREPGVYRCAACGVVLFRSGDKFDAGCGWPSFDKLAAAGVVKEITDHSYGMDRTEVVCANCGGHLGHVFDDGPTATGLRYCINSASIEMEPDSSERPMMDVKGGH